MKFSSFKKDQLLMESWRSFLKEDNETEEYDELYAKVRDGNITPEDSKRFRQLVSKRESPSWPTAPEGTKSDNPWHTAPEGSESDDPWYKEGDPDKLDDTRSNIEARRKYHPDTVDPGYEESFDPDYGAPTTYDEKMVNLILNKLDHMGVKIPDVDTLDADQLASTVARAIEDTKTPAPTSGETWTDSFGRVHKTQKPVEVEWE